MIKKFIKISGTGKFLNYTPNSVPAGHRTTDFEKINLIYAENGYGKTTLSIVLHSLKGNNNVLTKKRSFDRTVPQTVEIITDVTPQPKFTYANSVWDNHYPNIEIFDVHFINDNIYTGLEIQNSHKKNLFEIIFGQQGIVLKGEIQTLKDRIQKGSAIIREVTGKIEIAINGAYPAATYLGVSADPEIDTKITAKEAALVTARNFQNILSKQALSPIPILDLPYSTADAIKIFNQSVAEISGTYLKKFTEHKSHLDQNGKMSGKAEEWIKMGHEAIVDNCCPFCERTFDSTVHIIESYNQYFNQEYNLLLSAISSLDSNVSNFNLEAKILQIENIISVNANLMQFWGPHVLGHPSFSSMNDKAPALFSALSNLKESLKNKTYNPTQSCPTDSLTAFQSLIDSFNNNINQFNTSITEYNIKIGTLKNSPPPNVSLLEKDLNKLKAIKKRDDPAIVALCTNLSSYLQLSDTLNTQKTEKQVLLDNYTATIFANYSTKINLYLQAFAPCLEIRDLDSAYIGSSKEPMIKYALHINGNEIKLEESTTHASVKYSLSEGDKSALALAFFLTKLEVDGNIQNKIIVFDDPVSSFDLNRKSTTISKLLHFATLSKQLFVFTHNIIFAGEFWKSANQGGQTTQCSKIEYAGTSSCIVEYNIDTETMSSILKDSRTIKKYLSNGCFTDEERRAVARCLRPALESYFHLKFFDLVAPNDWLGDFISKVRDSITTDPFHRLQGSIQELSEINDYSKKYHHRFNTNNESEPITDNELRNFCSRTLALIQLI